MVTLDKQTKFAKLQARFYDEHPSLIPWPKLLVKSGLSILYKPREIFWKQELDKLGMSSSDKVLDVGCGQGVFLARLNKTYKVKGYGIDISENSIRYARKNFESKDLKFIVADAVKLPFPDKFFEFIVSFDTLEHIAEQKAALKEVVRVLKPGGKILIYTMNKNYQFTLDWIWEKLGFDIFSRACHSKNLFVDPDWLINELTKDGTKVVEIKLFDAFFTLLLDESIMFKIWLCLKSGLFKCDFLGKTLLMIANTISVILTPVLIILEAPWFKKGYSLSFLIVAKK